MAKSIEQLLSLSSAELVAELERCQARVCNLFQEHQALTACDLTVDGVDDPDGELWGSAGQPDAAEAGSTSRVRGARRDVGDDPSEGLPPAAGRAADADESEVDSPVESSGIANRTVIVQSFERGSIEEIGHRVMTIFSTAGAMRSLAESYPAVVEDGNLTVTLDGEEPCNILELLAVIEAGDLSETESVEIDPAELRRCAGLEQGTGGAAAVAEEVDESSGDVEEDDPVREDDSVREDGPVTVFTTEQVESLRGSSEPVCCQVGALSSLFSLYPNVPELSELTVRMGEGEDAQVENALEQAQLAEFDEIPVDAVVSIDIKELFRLLDGDTVADGEDPVTADDSSFVLDLDQLVFEDE
jgi:hypothetical protein